MNKIPKWLEKSREENPGTLRTYRIKYIGRPNDPMERFSSIYYMIATSKHQIEHQMESYGRITEVKALKYDAELNRLWEMDHSRYLKFWSKGITSRELVDIINRYRKHKQEIIERRIKNWKK